jgi:c(7)-type cytochrome triheme protein
MNVPIAGRPGDGPCHPFDSPWFPRRLGWAALVLPAILAGALATRATAQEGLVVLKRAPAGPTEPPPATFPHWIHRIRYRCYVCHPGEIGTAATPLTHDAMAKGQACGGCHDGRTAWGISFETCTRCHVAR